LIEFAEQNNLDMELEDVSTLEEYDIDLALLKIAQTGMVRKVWVPKWIGRKARQSTSLYTVTLQG
jgi:hypothetical protein